jgi:hypothetical protein
MATSEIESAIFQLVAQCLNQLRYRLPPIVYRVLYNYIKILVRWNATFCIFVHTNPVPKYNSLRPITQTHWHIKNVFISPYLTKCANKIILLDSVTLVPFHAPQLRSLFRGIVPFWLLQRDDDDLAYIWQLIYLTWLRKQWPAPTLLFLQDMDMCLSKLLP